MNGNDEQRKSGFSLNILRLQEQRVRGGNPTPAVTDMGPADSSDIESVESSLKSEWITTEEAASYLGLSVGALRNMTSSGHIPYYKLGNRNRYRVADLRTLLLANKRGV